MADKVIRWALFTQYKNGAYNSTYDYNILQLGFNLIVEFFQVQMPRVSKGWNIRVIQANVNKNNWAAWTSGNDIYISPTFNFGRSARRCAKVGNHEFGHIGNGTSHSRDPEALMFTDGGTSQGWVQDDLRWFNKYKLRGAMPPRGIFATRFGVQSPHKYQGVQKYGELDMFYGDSGFERAYDDFDVEPIRFGEANSIWDRFVSRFTPVYQMKDKVYCDK